MVNTRVINGTFIAAKMRAQVKAKIDAITAINSSVKPALGVIMAGERKDSKLYVEAKGRACREVGIQSVNRFFSSSVTQEEVLHQVHLFNNDHAIDGILVQMPLPSTIDEKVIIDAVLPTKDVDGLHPFNVGELSMRGRTPLFTACTPEGVVQMLDEEGVEINGKVAVVLGRSDLVGNPVGMLLRKRNATVISCHSKTINIPHFVRQADIVISACGVPHIVRGEWLKPGAVVIDVGINFINDSEGNSKMVGDVCFDEAIGVAGAITPVPGGVGPMTIAMLMRNVCTSFERRINLKLLFMPFVVICLQFRSQIPQVFRLSLTKANEAREPMPPLTAPSPRRSVTASSGHRQSTTHQQSLKQSSPYNPPFGKNRLSQAGIKPQASPREFTIDSRDKESIMFPYSNIADEDGSLQKIMWSKWCDENPGESYTEYKDSAQFTSFALYAQMKLQEAKRTASYLEHPNIFVTAVACSLLTSCANRLGASGGIVHQLLHVLTSAIYHCKNLNIMPIPFGTNAHSPYFIEYRRLRRTCVELLEENTRKINDTVDRKQGFTKLQRVIQGTTRVWKHRLLQFLFYQWVYYHHRRRRIRVFIERAFRHKNRGTIKEIFRAWRVEALRKAYYRESANYQTMLSVTAESLNRKDVQLITATEKFTKLQMHVDQMTASNASLIARVQELEGQIRLMKITSTSSSSNVQTTSPKLNTSTVAYERMDTILYEDNSKDNGRVNKMLLEGMFAMARMVEASVIQFSKDALEALESQFDGAELRLLSERISDEHAKIDNITTGYQNIHLTNVLSKPIDTILLHWARIKLEQSKVALRPQDRIIKNFSDDLADGSKFSTLLHYLYPLEYNVHMLQEIDVEQRLRNIERFNRELRIETSSEVKLPQVVTADSIATQGSTENVVFLGMLFAMHQSHFSRINTEKCRKIFLQIVASWKKVRSLMLEVKRSPEDPLGGENIMVVTLVKEMRRCEDLHSHLHHEITALTCSSSESACVLSKLMHRILCFSWRMLSQRDQGVDGDMVDERKAETIRKFTTVPVEDIRNIIEDEKISGGSRRNSVSDSEVMTRVFGIQRVLKHYFNDLHAIFRHYSCSTLRGHSSTMSLNEYSKFVKDCGIVDKKVMLPVVDAIYHHCVDDKDATSPREMNPPNFVQALVHIADKKFPTLPFEERIHELLEKFIVPNACRAQPEVFRLLLKSPEVRGVYQKYKVSLQYVFKYYSSMKSVDTIVTPNSKSSSTIDLNEFLSLTKDCKLIGSFITDVTVRHIFILVQHQYDDSETQVDMIAEDDSLQVDYSEFEEALAALTEYIICNPYVPLNKRLEQFISEMILPRARQKKKADLK
ncbi:hypothetical protein THRCLA_07681 [Thraustotheca clavata]|uniref:Calponin-homology (CH) domain-containing protein n=1 Tax=Thraustotheca clavata TaxID=74557 RepID=A0A1V9ZCL9_9STRA|nr:hypothetical protein THRCLA_07681 [Thraustotheca clavata]